MRLAAIDVGTNSVKLLVADVSDAGALTVVTEAAEVTRLGAGVDASGQLNADAITRTLAAVVRFAEAARAQGASSVLAAGTAALRDASNGADFIARAQQEAGVTVQIIAGEREAALAFGAVVSDPDMALPASGPVLVFDIGGGSTELIIGERGQMAAYVSLQIGAVRVTERFLHTDPPRQEEITAARAAVQARLNTFPVPDGVPFVVGLGGTAVNVASVTKARQGQSTTNLHAVRVTRRDVQDALLAFSACTLQERKALPGLEPARADIITGGALILNELLAHFGAEAFTVSVRGLRFGLLAEFARTGH